jgi:hypothetical protein
MSKILNLGNGFIQIDDYIIEKNAYDVIQKIKAYDPNLDVMFLDPSRSDGLFDAPWVVVEHCSDGFTRKVFDIWELNERVLERLYSADTKRTDVLATADSINAAIRENNERRFRERLEDNSDRFAHLLSSPKSTYKLETSDGSVLTIDDHYGVTKRAEK